MNLVMAVDTAQTVGTYSLAGVLVLAFGYTIRVLSSGTDRADRNNDARVDSVTKDRDWWRDEAGRRDARCADQLAALEHERDAWRDRYLDTRPEQGQPPVP